MQAAYDEIGRREEIDETLQFLLSTVRRVQLTNRFPAHIRLPQFELVECCALNLSAAIVDYLAIAIEHLCTPLSSKYTISARSNYFAANILKNIFIGSTTFELATTKIKEASDRFTDAVVDLGAVVGAELLVQSEKILHVVESISAQMVTLTNESSGNYSETFFELIAKYKSETQFSNGFHQEGSTESMKR